MQQLTGAPERADHQALPQAARDAMRRLELALTTPDPAIVEKVRVALGHRAGWKPKPLHGETASYLTVWSQIELNAIYERVGGTVTIRQVERSTSDDSHTWTATEITLTVQVPDVGPVDIVTDIEDDPEHGYRTDLPVVTAARYQAAAAHYQELAAHGDYEGCEYVRDEMVHLRQLVLAGGTELIEVA
jgi:hypothetical protein